MRIDAHNSEFDNPLFVKDSSPLLNGDSMRIVFLMIPAVSLLGSASSQSESDRDCIPYYLKERYEYCGSLLYPGDDFRCTGFEGYDTRPYCENPLAGKETKFTPDDSLGDVKSWLDDLPLQDDLNTIESEPDH